MEFTCGNAEIDELALRLLRTSYMLCDLADVIRASELIELAADRVIEHLTLAYELSARMRGEGGPGRSYG